MRKNWKWAAMLLLTLPSFARASTQLLFGGDGKTATILMIGVPSNPDAIALNERIAQAPQDEQGKWTKKVVFKDADGVNALDTICIFSKIAPGTGTCTVVVHASRGASLTPGSGQVGYAVQGDEAARLAAQFRPADGSGQVFRSSDGRLTFTSDASGFAVRYR